VQERPRGLADAIRRARGFAGDGAIAVVLPDNLFSGPAPALSHVLALAQRLGKSAVAMVAITAEDAARSGATAVYRGAMDDDEFRIAHIPDKGDRNRTFDTGGAAVAYTGVGRYAFGHELWSAIDEVASVLPAHVELDDIPVMQLLLHRGQLTGCLVRERFFDVGLPSGYAEAAAHYTIA
jgi:UTP-glucose-1-phosphate uridylyltransferase